MEGRFPAGEPAKRGVRVAARGSCAGELPDAQAVVHALAPGGRAFEASGRGSILWLMMAFGFLLPRTVLLAIARRIVSRRRVIAVGRRSGAPRVPRVPRRELRSLGLASAGGIAGRGPADARGFSLLVVGHETLLRRVR
jgi:hypothetical protein